MNRLKRLLIIIAMMCPVMACQAALTPIVRTATSIAVSCIPEAVKRFSHECQPGLQNALHEANYTKAVFDHMKKCAGDASADVAEASAACALRSIMTGAFGAMEDGADGSVRETAERSAFVIEAKGWVFVEQPDPL